MRCKAERSTSRASKKEIFEQVIYENSLRNFLTHDFVIVHDPQPLPLIEYYLKECPWIWRCHVDLSQPDAGIWKYLRQWMARRVRIARGLVKLIFQTFDPDDRAWTAIALILQELRRSLGENQLHSVVGNADLNAAIAAEGVKLRRDPPLVPGNNLRATVTDDCPWNSSLRAPA
jgi:hypothetical protein